MSPRGSRAMSILPGIDHRDSVAPSNRCALACMISMSVGVRSPNLRLISCIMVRYRSTGEVGRRRRAGGRANRRIRDWPLKQKLTISLFADVAFEGWRIYDPPRRTWRIVRGRSPPPLDCFIRFSACHDGSAEHSQRSQAPSSPTLRACCEKVVIPEDNCLDFEYRGAFSA